MFALAINGSPRKNGNTAILLNAVMEPLVKAGWETELFQMAGKTIRGCLACGKCFETHDMQCINKKDALHEDGLLEKMFKADAIIMGSPTYFADATPELKAVIDRAGFVAMANGAAFAGKIGAAVMAVRRGGSTHVFDTINHFFQISQMLIPGSTYWNMAYGFGVGEVKNDAEGMANMAHLGKAIDWLGKATIPNLKTYPKNTISLA